MDKNETISIRTPFPKEQIGKMPRATIDKDDYKKLTKEKCSICNGFHPKTHTIHLDYVGHAALTNRLLDVDPNWNWEPLTWATDGTPLVDADGGMWIKLTINGVTRLGYGDSQGKTGPNATKERIGDALRNAAMRFGAALELWSKEDLGVEPEPAKKEKPVSQPVKPKPEDPPPPDPNDYLMTTDQGKKILSLRTLLNITSQELLTDPDVLVITDHQVVKTFNHDQAECVIKLLESRVQA